MRFNKLKLLPLTAALVITGAATSVALKNKKDQTVITNAEGTSVTLTHVGQYGWNNKSLGSHKKALLLRFSANPNGGVADTTNQAVSGNDFGEKVTLNGELVKNISGFYADYGSLGSANVCFSYEINLLDEYDRLELHVPAGTSFYDLSLPEFDLTLIDGVWCLGKFGKSNTTLKGFPADSWNNNVSGGKASNIITFNETLGTTDDKKFPYSSADYISLAAKYITIDGVSLYAMENSGIAGEASKTILDYSQGSGHVYFTFPETYQHEGSILRFEEGIPFASSYLQGIQAVLTSGKWVFQNVPFYNEPTVNFSAIESSYNNKLASGYWGSPDNYRLTAFTFDGDIIPSAKQVTKGHAIDTDLKQAITINGKTFASLNDEYSAFYINAKADLTQISLAFMLRPDEIYEGAKLVIPNGIRLFNECLPGLTFTLISNSWVLAKTETSTLQGLTVSADWNNKLNNGYHRTIFRYTTKVTSTDSHETDITAIAGDYILFNNHPLTYWNTETANSIKVKSCPAFTYNESSSFYVDISESIMKSDRMNTLVIEEGVNFIGGYAEPSAAYFSPKDGGGFTGFQIVELIGVRKLVKSLHMGENTDGQCSGYLRFAQANYQNLTLTTSKYFFKTQYTAEYDRFVAWLKHNGLIIENYQIRQASGNVGLSLSVPENRSAFVVSMLIVVVGVAFASIVLTKKRKHN